MRKGVPLKLNERILEHCLINHDTLCQYMFKQYTGCIKVLIDDGHGWRTYDSAMVAGNYAIAQARTFWNSLVKQGFKRND
jgi:hypothetical protein